MKTFLQDCKTAKFIRIDSGWTLDMSEALDFLSVKRAVGFGMKELKDSFQILQIKPGARRGNVILTVSNLLWVEVAQPAFNLSPVNALPKPGPARECSGNLRLGAGRGKIPNRANPPIPLIQSEPDCDQITTTFHGRETPHSLALGFPVIVVP